MDTDTRPYPDGPGPFEQHRLYRYERLRCNTVDVQIRGAVFFGCADHGLRRWKSNRSNIPEPGSDERTNVFISRCSKLVSRGRNWPFIRLTHSGRPHRMGRCNRFLIGLGRRRPIQRVPGESNRDDPEYPLRLIRAGIRRPPGDVRRAFHGIHLPGKKGPRSIPGRCGAGIPSNEPYARPPTLEATPLRVN